MNSFRLISTVVIKSEMDFTKVNKDLQYKCAVHISTSTKTPRDATKHRNIYCSVTLSLGEENDSLKISMKTLSKFEITELDDSDTLRQDSQNYCPRQAVKEALKKLERLTELHVGEPLHIPLPPNME